MITISADAPKRVAAAFKDAEATASSFVNDAEAPAFALDGDLSTKWCATGNAPHELMIDLGRPQTVSEVRLAHARLVEGPDMNTRAYTVLVSEDGKDYEPVSRTLKNEAGNSTNTFAVKNVQYVKISIDKPTQGADSAANL